MQSGKKLMQGWSADAVHFMEDASAYGDYHRKLAETIKPFLPSDGEICDAGCGLGHLAYELSAFCKKVTAIDCAHQPIAFLNSHLHRENLTGICTDIFSLQRQFDAMVFCYFGRMNEILRISRRLCKGTVVVVHRDCSEHRFSLSQVARHKHSDFGAEELLKALNIPYTCQQLSMELGQPFRSIDEAVRFFELYNKSDATVDETAIFPRLQKIVHPEFSYYLPEQRKMELLVFQTKDIPEEGFG